MWYNPLWIDSRTTHNAATIPNFLAQLEWKPTSPLSFNQIHSITSIFIPNPSHPTSSFATHRIQLATTFAQSSTSIWLWRNTNFLTREQSPDVLHQKTTHSAANSTPTLHYSPKTPPQVLHYSAGNVKWKRKVVEQIESLLLSPEPKIWNIYQIGQRWGKKCGYHWRIIMKKWEQTAATLNFGVDEGQCSFAC